MNEFNVRRYVTGTIHPYIMVDQLTEFVEAARELRRVIGHAITCPQRPCICEARNQPDAVQRFDRAYDKLKDTLC